MKLEARGLRWTWPDGTPGLGPLDLQLEGGALVLVTGPSGAGKSTLLRLLAGLLGGDGRGGSVALDGVDPATLRGAARARRVGFVAQVPGDQLVAGTVRDELAFGPEGACEPPAEMRAQVLTEITRLGLPDRRRTSALSGGQQQRLAAAAARACGAPLLLLDEPLAWLDQEAAAALIADLRRLADRGTLVIVAEHRLDALRPVADRELRLTGGASWTQEARDGLDSFADQTGARSLSTGSSTSAARREPGAWTDQGADPVGSGQGGREPRVDQPPGQAVGSGRHPRDAITLRPARVTRGGWTLDVERWTQGATERVALVGPNGAGKSTLLAALAAAVGGLRVVRLPQDPDLALFSATVREEIAWAGGGDVDGLAARLGLQRLLDRPPHALSRGERLRVAVAAALAARPALLLLDEPTAGQDPEHADAVLAALSAAGVAVVVATHDPRVVAWADRTAQLRGGRLGGGEREAAAREEVDEGEGLDPRVRLTLLLCLATWVMVVDQPASLLVLAALAWAAVWRAPSVPRLPVLGAALALGWSTALGQALFRDLPGQTLLLRVGPVTLWWEGFVHGLVQSLRVAAISFGGLALVASTPPDRLLLALRGLGVPWAVAFLTSSSLRVVPQIASSWSTVRAAQAARGEVRGARRLRAELDALRPLIARAVRHAAVLAESLKGRGFDPAGRRTVAHPLRARPAEVALGGAVVLLTLAVVGARALFLLYTSGLWYAPALRPLYAWVRAWL
jgi:energy-coupling factor transporter ATP-binding protein EcfA2